MPVKVKLDQQENIVSACEKPSHKLSQQKSRQVRIPFVRDLDSVLYFFHTIQENVSLSE